MKYHQGIRAEVDARGKSFTACIELGKKLLQRKHQDSPEVRAAGVGAWQGRYHRGPPVTVSPCSQIKAKLVELVDKRKAMMETWEQRWDRLRLCECTGGAGEDRASAWRGGGGKGLSAAHPCPQCWRCASSPGTPRWPSHGSWHRSPTWPAATMGRRWTRWRSCSSGTRLSRSPRPPGRSASLP